MVGKSIVQMALIPIQQILYFNLFGHIKHSNIGWEIAISKVGMVYIMVSINLNYDLVFSKSPIYVHTLP